VGRGISAETRGSGRFRRNLPGTSVSLETGNTVSADLVSGRPCGHARPWAVQLAVWLLELEPPAADCCCLPRGELGAGKTQLVQGLAAALGHARSLSTSRASPSPSIQPAAARRISHLVH